MAIIERVSSQERCSCLKLHLVSGRSIYNISCSDSRNYHYKFVVLIYTRVIYQTNPYKNAIWLYTAQFLKIRITFWKFMRSVRFEMGLVGTGWPGYLVSVVINDAIVNWR